MNLMVLIIPSYGEQADKAKSDVSQNPVKGAFVGYADDAPIF